MRRVTKTAVGIDVGGTFTDVIVSDSIGLSVLKIPTTSDPSVGVVHAIRRLRRKVRSASFISHATTLATNALLTRTNLPRAALVTNEGFRDVLEIGRQRRPEVYSLRTGRPPPLIERRHRLTVSCRIGADGEEVAALAEIEAERLAKRIANEKFQSVAVCFLNSHMNGVHEMKIRNALRRTGYEGHISISSEVDPEYREYERTSTTVVNAVLSPLISGHLASIRSSVARSGISAPIYVMNSDGGSSTIGFASSMPVTILESGPAAGVVASKVLAERLSLKSVITFDMGGTTAKAGTVIDGDPGVTGEFEAAGRSHSGRSIRGSGYSVRGDFIDLAEVSAGGGTVAWVDDAGDLKVGPRSAGSNPGPACYGRGGVEPTVTDANVVLGRLNPVALLGGSMTIHSGLAFHAVEKLATAPRSDVRDTATGIIRLVNNEMSKAISMVTVERGRDPRDFVLVAFGGAGPVHACDLADEMGIDEIVVPIHAGLFSAYGLLAGELTRTFAASIMEVEPRLETRFRVLEEVAAKAMRKEGLTRFSFRRYLECRYVGQSHEALLAFESDDKTRATFDEKHRTLYGYSLPDRMEVVRIKVKAVVAGKSPELVTAAPNLGSSYPRERTAWVGDEDRSVDVFVRELMEVGTSGKGPAIIEEYDSTLVVNPSWNWLIDANGTRLRR